MLGNNINFSQLANQLNRPYMSVRHRVAKLKTGNSRRELKVFSETDDLIIMDKVLESLPGRTLEDLNICLSEVAISLGRLERCVRYRWDNKLKLWLLQHYSGTLNLDIRRMLANYLADNFDSIDTINWLSVSKKAEFVGFTHQGLRVLFSGYLVRSAQRQMNLEKSKITLKDIADNANVMFSEGNCTQVNRKADLMLKRQKVVIDYFERYVKKHSITNFI